MLTAQDDTSIISRQTDRQTDQPGNFRMPISTEDYVELANMLIQDWGNVEGSPQRLAILLGMLKKDQTVGSPDKSNRSSYSMEKYAYLLNAPFKVSSKCCDVMKKQPAHKYAKQTGRVPMTAQMASESHLRTQKWIQNGCNGFDMKSPISNPMAFWTEQDVLKYIKVNDVPICSVYGDIVVKGPEGDQYDFSLDPNAQYVTTGCSRTGCIFCGYGCHLEKEKPRFEMLKRTHPKLYEYIMKPIEDGGLGYKDVIDWINKNGNNNIRY